MPRQARSSTLSRNETGLVLRIIDDGIGIASNTLVKPMSHGLLGMRERALLLGGMLTIRRGRNDAGTCIEVHIPLAATSVLAETGASAAATTVGMANGADVASVAGTTIPGPVVLSPTGEAPIPAP